MAFIDVPDGSSVVADLLADGNVSRVEADRIRTAEADPSDSGYADQWSLPKIGWNNVFGTVTPSGSAVVALLDTGVDASHPDLAGQLVPGTSILDGSAGTVDPNGHGTAMAGIIAALTDNGQGIAGIGYAGVKVMPVTVLDANGEGTDSDIIQGVIWAVDHGADVINMSFSNPGFSDALQAAIDYAWAHNVVVVAATGNDGSSTVTFPAGDRGVIGVSNTDQSDTLDPSSNDGPDVFLAAPGVGILTLTPGGGTSSVTGTSASSAEVAAAAALLRASDPAASNGVIVGRLGRSAEAAGTVDQTGNGRLDLERAIADTGTELVQPAGAAPVGSGGPIVGPYVAAASAPSGTVLFPATGSIYNASRLDDGVFDTSLDDICGTATAGGGEGVIQSVRSTASVRALGTTGMARPSRARARTFSHHRGRPRGRWSSRSPTSRQTAPTPSESSLRIRTQRRVLTRTHSPLDTVAPTLTGGGQSTTPTNSTALSFTISGNENISCSTLTSSDFTLTNASFVSSTQTTASLCTIALTSSIGAGSTGTSTVALSGTFGATDTAGNSATIASGFPMSWTVDRQAPTLTLAAVTASPTNSTSLTFTLTGDENLNCGSISTTNNTDFTFGNISSIGPITGSGTTVCTIPATSSIGPGATGTSSLTKAGSFSVSDVAGNAQTVVTGSPASVTVDRQVPSVTAFTCVPAAGLISATSLSCSVTFSKSVTGFDATTSDLTIGGTSTAWTSGASSPASGTGPYTFTVSRGAPNSDGSLTLQIAAAAAQDASGNSSTASSTLSYTLDTVAPTLTGGGQSTTPTNSTALSFTISGNENISCSTLTSSDFTLTNASFVSSTQTTASLCTIALTSSIGAGSTGTSTVALSGTFGATDTAGNSATIASGFPMSWTVDRQAPTLTLAAVTASPTNSTSLTFTLTGDENLNCAIDLDDQQHRLHVRQHQLDRADHGAGTTVCTIPATSSIGPGATGTSSLTKAGSFSVSDIAGNAQTVVTGSPASVTVDRQVPSVTAFTCVPAAGLISATSLSCSVTFSESVTGFDATTSDLTIGGTSTAWTSGASSPASGTGPYTFTVSRGAPNSDGSLTLQIAAAAAQDASGNSSTASSTLSYTLDTTAPTLTGGGQSTTPTNNPALSFTISGNENISCSTLTSADFTLTNASFTPRPRPRQPVHDRHCEHHRRRLDRHLDRRPVGHFRRDRHGRQQRHHRQWLPDELDRRPAGTSRDKRHVVHAERFLPSWAERLDPSHIQRGRHRCWNQRENAI